MEIVFALACDSRQRQRTVRLLRAGELQLLRGKTRGFETDSAAMEALRAERQPEHRRSTRSSVRRKVFSTGSQGPRAGNGGESHRSAAKRCADPWLDGAGY